VLSVERAGKPIDSGEAGVTSIERKNLLKVTGHIRHEAINLVLASA
jgi:hypothetical protein